MLVQSIALGGCVTTYRMIVRRGHPNVQSMIQTPLGVLPLMTIAHSAALHEPYEIIADGYLSLSARCSPSCSPASPTNQTFHLRTGS